VKVILLQEVKGTGRKDQILEVSDGFARNFLLPRKLAREATAEALNSIEKAKDAQQHREDMKKAEAEHKARDLKGKLVVVKAKAGEGGRLYGSVTAAEIADALKAQHGIEVDRRKIELEEPIRTAGQTTFGVRLTAGVVTRMLLNVVAESKEKEKAK
jgi:large subunit ribosomal protein L9